MEVKVSWFGGCFATAGLGQVTLCYENYMVLETKIICQKRSVLITAGT